MEKIFVTPKKNLIVPDQLGNPLPSEGKLVNDSRYWKRRAKEGDITIGKPPKPEKKKKD